MITPVSNNIQNDSESKVAIDTTKVYKVYPRRFGILAIFCICSLSSGFQWIQYVIIQNIIVRYYNESLPDSFEAKNNAVTWTSLSYMVTYIPLMFPAMWLLDRYGLKITCSTGAFLNSLGAIIKCFSVARDRWWVAFSGQLVCACAQSFTLGIPPYLAASWFGSRSVSTVTAIAVFGNQAIFRRFPPTPPSKAQELALQNTEQNYGQTLKRLLFNRWFLLLLLSYGLNTGTFYSISTLLNPIYMWYFDKKTAQASQYAGTIGMLLVIGADGLFCSRFFMTGYLPVGFEYGVEITYPENEAISSSLLNVSAQIFGLCITQLQEFLIFKQAKILESNIMLCIVLVVGAIITLLIRSPLRRQNAQHSTHLVFEPNNSALVSNTNSTAIT
ncbi:unnamed protein product [Rotaria socialis]|uniref:Uncharacterized protein n=1 Tax=Rotaria socialis TaxID=392032 RepID=A0A820QNB7_9BILA|nr:unnamed protein product [Rotaria socialis]